VLREAGLVEVARKRGTWVYYRLVPEVVSELAFALGGSDPRQPAAAAL
jgi:DNA-binding transcriptional ArsR family regulator